LGERGGGGWYRCTEIRMVPTRVALPTMMF
jgi:hypothetical protein